MVTTTRTARTSPWRSASPIPVRAASDAQPDRTTATPRIPIALSFPSVPDGMFRPSAFAGEIVPFRTTAFREGHDLIGVHVRLFSPSGDESLHRLLPLHDGFDRWETAVTPLEEGVWTLPVRSVRRRLRHLGARRRSEDRGGGRHRRSCARSAPVCSSAQWPRSRVRSPSAAVSRDAAGSLRDPDVERRGQPRDRPRPVDRRRSSRRARSPRS